MSHMDKWLTSTITNNTTRNSCDLKCLRIPGANLMKDSSSNILRYPSLAKSKRCKLIIILRNFWNKLNNPRYLQRITGNSPWASCKANTVDHTPIRDIVRFLWRDSVQSCLVSLDTNHGSIVQKAELLTIFFKSLLVPSKRRSLK